MTTLEPGLYRATVRGEADTTVLIATSGFGHTSERIGPEHVHGPEKITDARPLIVLDLEDAPHINGPGARLDPVAWIRHTASREWNPRGGLLRWIADQIEAQTKPAKIEEPGLYGVVKASLNGKETGRVTWVRHLTGWYRAADDEARLWTDLIDPTLIRDGIES